MLATVETLASGRAAAAGGMTGAVVLPADAVQLVRGKPTVFVAVSDGKGGARFTGRDVDVGAPMSGRVTVLRGVTPGELVVIQGAFAVKAALEKGRMPKMEM
jgi:cobalt-zinc-cadmium efflux system membrane fusion protein